jgi:hypothetical protein
MNNRLAYLPLLSLGFILLLFFGCSGNSSSSGENPPSPEDKSLYGTAAAGAPVVGIVNVKGAHGNTASSDIESDGAYSLDVSGLTAPYILYASGSANGKSIKIYSSSVEEGAINITPVTDFILHYALGASPEDAFAGWDESSVSGTELADAESLVESQLKPVLNALGLTGNPDLLSDAFTAGGPGMDELLEALEITYSGNSVTVTNRLTGSSYTGDISSSSGTGLPLSDEAQMEAVMDDNDAINAVWDVLEGLFASGIPSLEEVNANFAQYIADDHLESGMNKTQQINDIVSGDGPTSGLKLYSIITDIKTINPYAKAYTINLFYSSQYDSGSFDTCMVYNGSQWLWHGNGDWADMDVSYSVDMETGQTGVSAYNSGINVDIDDNYNYAYDNGVRSAIVTGEGLPAEGLILAHTYPDVKFRIYPGLDGNAYNINNDAVLSAFSENETYTINLYTETADSVTLADVPVYSKVKTVGYKPYLISEVNESLFPELLSPDSHSISATNIPGILNVSWNNPSGIEFPYIVLVWGDGVDKVEVWDHVNKGATTAILDSSTSIVTPLWSFLIIIAFDDYDRMLFYIWRFDGP